MLRSQLVALSLVALCLASRAGAQIVVPRLEETIEVRVVGVDVVVTDRDGNPVHGLTRDDFELLEAGVPQPITNFSEFRSGGAEAAGTDPPQRRIVIFIDSATTNVLQRKRAVEALVGFVRKLRPGDEALVVSWNRRLTTVVPPTGDAAKLEEGIRRACGEVSLAMGAPDPDADSVQVRLHARLLSAEVRRAAAAIGVLLGRLAGVEGRKALILLSAGLSMRPGSELLAADDQLLLDSDEFNNAAVIQDVAKKANAAGVVLYPLHGVGLEGAISVEDTNPRMFTVRVRRNADSLESLSHLAARTGGIVAANTNDFSGALGRVDRDLSNYYSIGYRTQLARVDREREIEVRTRDRSLSVRARRSVVERSHEAETLDRIVSNLYFGVASNQLGISATAGDVTKRRRNRLAMPVDVKIPLGALAFSPAGNAYEADLSLFITCVDEKGNPSDVLRFQHKIRKRADQLPRLARQTYTYGFDVDLTSPGAEHRFSVAVIDNTTKATGFVVATAKGR